MKIEMPIDTWGPYVYGMVKEEKLFVQLRFDFHFPVKERKIKYNKYFNWYVTGSNKDYGLIVNGHLKNEEMFNELYKRFQDYKNFVKEFNASAL